MNLENSNVSYDRWGDIAALEKLFLKCPETGKDLRFSSPIQDFQDGSYAFEVKSLDGMHTYKHTIKTDEQQKEGNNS